MRSLSESVNILWCIAFIDYEHVVVLAVYLSCSEKSYWVITIVDVIYLFIDFLSNRYTQSGAYTYVPETKNRMLFYPS